LNPAAEATNVSRATAPLASVAELVHRLPSGATVIAVTDDGADPRYAAVRQVAARAAARVGGTLLFCVVPARDPGTPRSGPRLFLPTIDPGVGERPHTGTRSRDLLLAEAREVAAPGLVVGVWLPSRHGPSGVAEAVDATGAALVLVPARRKRRPAVLDRTLEYLAARVGAPVVSVAPDGTWSRVSALGEPPGAWWRHGTSASRASAGARIRRVAGVPQA
jgi:hypothetical protein